MAVCYNAQSKMRLICYVNKAKINFIKMICCFLFYLGGKDSNMLKALMVLYITTLIVGCTELPPKNSDNICITFREKDNWYPEAVKAELKWGIPVPVMMAIMHQESHFVADAKPPRTWLLGIIPWTRPSSAYGYAQVVDDTWDDYLDDAGSWFADRDDFADATDFIGWYCANTASKLGIAKSDVKNLYLVYHEGPDGYKRKSYLKNTELTQTANSVSKRAKLFTKQLSNCQIEQ